MKSVLVACDSKVNNLLKSHVNSVRALCANGIVLNDKLKRNWYSIINISKIESNLKKSEKQFLQDRDNVGLLKYNCMKKLHSY